MKKLLLAILFFLILLLPVTFSAGFRGEMIINVSNGTIEKIGVNATEIKVIQNNTGNETKVVVTFNQTKEEGKQFRFREKREFVEEFERIFRERYRLRLGEEVLNETIKEVRRLLERVPPRFRPIAEKAVEKVKLIFEECKPYLEKVKEYHRLYNQTGNKTYLELAIDYHKLYAECVRSIARKTKEEVEEMIKKGSVAKIEEELRKRIRVKCRYAGRLIKKVVSDFLAGRISEEELVSRIKGIKENYSFCFKIALERRNLSERVRRKVGILDIAELKKEIKEELIKEALLERIDPRKIRELKQQIIRKIKEARRIRVGKEEKVLFDLVRKAVKLGANVTITPEEIIIKTPSNKTIIVKKENGTVVFEANLTGKKVVKIIPRPLRIRTIEYVNGTLYINGKPVRLDPTESLKIVCGKNCVAVKEAVIDEEGNRTVMIVRAIKVPKLFGIIPLPAKVEEEGKVDLETGKLKGRKIKGPWWVRLLAPLIR